MRNFVRLRSTFPPALFAAALFAAALLPSGALAQDRGVGVLEVSVEPAFPAAFGQELRLRVRVSNGGAVKAKGVALDAKVGSMTVGHVDLHEPMGPGEQRLITLATHFKPAGAECITVIPIVAPDSPVRAGSSRLACLTPGCYSLSERPGS